MLFELSISDEDDATVPHCASGFPVCKGKPFARRCRLATGSPETTAPELELELELDDEDEDDACC